jgi:hypothetical protein
VIKTKFIIYDDRPVDEKTKILQGVAFFLNPERRVKT